MANDIRTDETYDDGLVHSHGWACGERGRAVHRPVNDPPEQDDDRFDDGLVHGHSWACGERGRPAHG